MVVVQLKKKGSIVDILFDNSESLKIPYELFVKNNLYIGNEISEIKFHELILQTQIFQIKQSAFRYLGLRNHSRNELKLKLLKKGLDKNLISIALDEISALGLLDEKKFAEEYFDFQIKKKKGPIKIKSELMNKGIDRKIIDEIINEYNYDSRIEETLFQLIEKKIKLLEGKNLTKEKINQKLYFFLIQKGYSIDLIKKSLKKISKDIDE
jgi:regulatory protein